MFSEIVSKGVVEGIIAGVLYDVFTLVIAFFIVKIGYEKFYMNWRWGRWKIQVIHSQKNDFQKTERVLLPKKAKEIFEDEGEFSIYVKGIVASTNTWLNTDIASISAKEIGLVSKYDEKREIVIDIAKNPKKKKSITFTEETQKQIDYLVSTIQKIEEQCTSSSPTTSPMINAEGQ